MRMNLSNVIQLIQAAIGLADLLYRVYRDYCKKER
jgi:hypothetical protein